MTHQVKKRQGCLWGNTLFVPLLCFAASIAGSHNALALQPTKIHFSCPEGTQTVEEHVYPFFQPSIDLFAGLSRDMRRIRVCQQSRFPSYRKFTKDELNRIAVLMETTEYRTRQQTETPGALALWVERELNGAADLRLTYQLQLQDAYTAIKGNVGDLVVEAQRLNSVFDVVRAGHVEFASDPGDLVRLQIQLAFLSHKTGRGLATDWFLKAKQGFSQLPLPGDSTEQGISSAEKRKRQLSRFQVDSLRRNIDALSLCFDGPIALSKSLCEARLKPQSSRSGYHGIEALARWALRGPTTPDSTKKQDRLRSRLKRLENSTSKNAPKWRIEIERQLAKGPKYFRHQASKAHRKMQTILEERDTNPLFKEYFDRFFIKNIKGRTHRYAEGSYYYCDLFDLITPYIKGQCHLDGTPAWAEAHTRFADLMAELREERRQEVLHYAAFYHLKGVQDHPSVEWAIQQDDFGEAIAAYQQNNGGR